MKTYPSIPNLPFDAINGKYIIAFNKLDGSNIRAEWSKKKGFYKFGSRKHLINKNDPQLGESISLIEDSSSKIEKVLTDKKIDRAVCFFEYWGEKSQFGYHDKDDKHYVTLIDISLYKKGMLVPEEFVKWFDKDIVPDILFEGNVDYEFYYSIKNGTLPGLGSEGVVCKSGIEKHQGLWMSKIKRQSWLDKLKSFCKDDDRKYKELA